MMSKMGSPLKPHKRQEIKWLSSIYRDRYTFQRYKCPNCGNICVVAKYKSDKPEMGGVPRWE
jgi:ribosomal protein S27AE